MPCALMRFRAASGHRDRGSTMLRLRSAAMRDARGIDEPLACVHLRGRFVAECRLETTLKHLTDADHWMHMQRRRRAGPVLDEVQARLPTEKSCGGTARDDASLTCFCQTSHFAERPKSRRNGRAFFRKIANVNRTKEVACDRPWPAPPTSAQLGRWG